MSDWDNKIKDRAWQYLIDECGVTEDTLQYATHADGYTEETLEAVLFWKTGYRSFAQIAEASPDYAPPPWLSDEDDECDHSDARVCEGIGCPGIPADGPSLGEPWWANR